MHGLWCCTQWVVLEDCHVRLPVARLFRTLSRTSRMDHPDDQRRQVQPAILAGVRECVVASRIVSSDVISTPAPSPASARHPPERQVDQPGPVGADLAGRRPPPCPEVEPPERSRERAREEEREYKTENPGGTADVFGRGESPFHQGQGMALDSQPVRQSRQDRRSDALRHNAATTITSGKKETKALPASATLRSTNSISSILSHARQRRVRCSQPRTVTPRG
jgi:hypothetical protein